MAKRLARRNTKATETKIVDDSDTRGPKPRWTERVDASVSPAMKARMDQESAETGLSAAGIVRHALSTYFEEKDGERIL